MIETTEPALQPATIHTRPGAAYNSHARRWQGIPGIERARNGRLWATWYSGGQGEGPDNYVVLVTSEADGLRAPVAFSEPMLVVEPEPGVRAYDPCLWHDPMGRLWLFWAQSEGMWDGRGGVWCIHCDNAEGAQPEWSAPQRLANGVMMNKPTVLSTGKWLLPTAVWEFFKPHRTDLAAERRSNVTCSTDQGRTWRLLGGADVPERQFDEHMVVERRDGSLWMLVRTGYGIGESASLDGGRTWSPGKPTALGGPGSRFFVRRMRSGRLLLVNHHRFRGRNNLTAMLSEDDGRNWRGGLLLDGRDDVSYPDGVETEDGRIIVIYDRERQRAREILMAAFTEEDILLGEIASEGAQLRVVVNRAED